MDIVDIIMQIAVLVFAVIIHEVAHGYVAFKLGDPTAKKAGRLTLNPIPHIDPFMSVILPVLLIFSGSPFVIGGAKPVPINPAYFRNHKKDVMLVSLAGPASNVAMALIGILLFIIVVKVPFLNYPGLFRLMQYMILINVLLAVFNLLPIPPLDGSNVIMGFLSDEAAYNYSKMAPYGFIILCALLYFKVINLLFMPIFLGMDHLLAFIAGN